MTTTKQSSNPVEFSGWKMHLLESQLYSSVAVGCCKLLLVGNGGENSLDPLMILLARGVSTLITVFILQKTTVVPDGPFGKQSDRKLLMFEGLLQFVGRIFIYYSLVSWSITEHSCFLFLAPLIMQLLRWMFQGEDLSSVKLVALVMSFVGVAFMAQIENRGWVVTFALLGTIAGSIRYSTLKPGGIPHPVITDSYGPICTILGSILGLMFVTPVSWVMPSCHQWAIIVTMGAANIFGQIHMDKAVKGVILYNGCFPLSVV